MRIRGEIFLYWVYFIFSVFPSKLIIGIWITEEICLCVTREHFFNFTDHTLHKGPQSVNPVNELKDIVRKQLNLKEKIVWLILAFIWPELRRVISLAIVILLLEILRENFDKGRRCELDKNGMKVFKSVCRPDRQKEEKLMKQEWQNWILILTLKYFVIRILWANGKLNGLRESLEGLDTYNSL